MQTKNRDSLLPHISTAIAHIMVWIAIAGATFCGGSGMAGEPPVRDPEAAKVAKLDSLIDALANRNKPPRIIPGLSIRNLGPDLPVFRENYDWAEQERVLKALDVLVQREGGDLGRASSNTSMTSGMR